MKTYILLILLSFSGNTFADTLKSIGDARKLSDKMVNLISKEKFKNAFDSAKPFWPLPKVEIDGLVNQIKQQWPIVNQRFGKTTGTEFIKKENIGNSFLRFYYLHKFENHAIYWQFDFYKPKKAWKINHIKFLDSLDTLYE